jgi:hypothetical protein
MYCRPVVNAFRMYSAQSQALKRQAINTNQDLQQKRVELENRAKEAEVRKLELANMMMEVELMKQRRELGLPL